MYFYSNITSAGGRQNYIALSCILGSRHNKRELAHPSRLFFISPISFIFLRDLLGDSLVSHQPALSHFNALFCTFGSTP